MIGRLSPTGLLRKRTDLDDAVGRHGIALGRVLNVGSKGRRIGEACVNLDRIAGPQVDVVGDAHDLARLFGAAAFDTVVLSAVLQYCAEPGQVARQAATVLRPGGMVLVDAPFMQPYCEDGPDLWRFTEPGLRRLFDPHFAIEELSVSIPSGPALAYAAVATTAAIRNRYWRSAAQWALSAGLSPFAFASHTDHRTAGAFVLVGRKRVQDARPH